VWVVVIDRWSVVWISFENWFVLLNVHLFSQNEGIWFCILQWILTVRILEPNDALGTLSTFTFAFSICRRSFCFFAWTSRRTSLWTIINCILMRRKNLRLRSIDESVFIFGSRHLRLVEFHFYSFLYWCFQLWENDVLPFLDCWFRWKLLNEIKFWNLFAMMFFINSLYNFLFLERSGFLLAVDNAQSFCNFL